MEPLTIESLGIALPFNSRSRAGEPEHAMFVAYGPPGTPLYVWKLAHAWIANAYIDHGDDGHTEYRMRGATIGDAVACLLRKLSEHDLRVFREYIESLRQQQSEVA